MAMIISVRDSIYFDWVPKPRWIPVASPVGKGVGWLAGRLVGGREGNVPVCLEGVIWYARKKYSTCVRDNGNNVRQIPKKGTDGEHRFWGTGDECRVSKMKLRLLGILK